MTAAYSGDPTYAPQSGTLIQTELGTAAPTGFTLTTTKGPLTVGAGATLTATLTGTPIPGVRSVSPTTALPWAAAR